MAGKTSLGKYISTRRKNMGLTQEEFADELGVSKSAVAKWETDGGIPDRENLRNLSEKLGVSVNELYRIIKSKAFSSVDFEINITPEIIATLESHGYKVIRPEVGDELE